jgi:nucleoporin POM152
MQVIGPKGTKTVKVSAIDTPQKTVQISIPEDIDAEGGSFGIDLVSIEDAYGCRRTITVPGISVNVRRVKVSADDGCQL